MGTFGRLVKSTFGIKKLGGGTKPRSLSAAARLVPDNAPAAATDEIEPPTRSASEVVVTTADGTTRTRQTSSSSTPDGREPSPLQTPARASPDHPHRPACEPSTSRGGAQQQQQTGGLDLFVRAFIDGVPTPPVRAPPAAAVTTPSSSDLAERSSEETKTDDDDGSGSDGSGSALPPGLEGYVPGWARTVGTALASSPTAGL